MKPLAKADRRLIAEFGRRLAVDFRYERHDGAGLAFLAGSRGTVRPVDGRLVLTMRPAATAVVDHHRRQLLASGLLCIDGEATVLSRLPEATEVFALRDLLGMQKAWAAPALPRSAS